MLSGANPPTRWACRFVDRQANACSAANGPTHRRTSTEIAREIGAQVESISLVADFTAHQLNGPIDPRAFKFEVPADAEIVKFFIPPDPGQLLSKKVPDFKFVGLDGKPVTPQSLAGKIAVLDFWATWCDPCKASLPNLQKVYEKYKDNDKVAFVAVSVTIPKRATRP